MKWRLRGKANQFGATRFPLDPMTVFAGEALDSALGGIAVRYGAGTTDFVAMQLEYPRHRVPQ
jgi:hypothetical protein